MALTEKELQLALKGYPVKTLNGYPVDRIKIIGNRLVGYTHSSSDYAFWHLNGVHVGNNKLNLHLDHTEARRINFVPQPEFGDEIEVCGGEITAWKRTYFVQWDKDGDCMAVEPENAVLGLEQGIEDYRVETFDYWRWPQDSPYNLTRYRVYKNDEEIPLSGEQEEKVKEVVEGECETHGEEPKPGEWYWISSYHIPCGRFDHIDGGNPDQYIMAGYYEGDGWARDRIINKHYVLNKMTPSEIETELDRIRKEMGFVEGAKVRCLESGLEKHIKDDEADHSPNDKIWVYCYEGCQILTIYKGGQFAEIISPAETDERYIAVYAPEDWQKEKVARIWGVDIVELNCLNYDYLILLPDPKGLLQLDTISSPGCDDFTTESFHDFCHRHGEEPRPDYVKGRASGRVYQVKGWDDECRPIIGNPWPDRALRKWHPATKKEYDNQNKE